MKTLRLTLRLLVATLLALLVMTGVAWLWSGTGSSLATALDQAAHHLPAGHALEVKQVKGSLRSGGTIGWLRWQQGALSVEASDVSVAWTLRPLLNGQLRIDQLRAHQVRVTDSRSASAPAAPTQLRLPFQVDAHLAVDALEWAGAAIPAVAGLSGHYVFDSYLHTLDGGSAHISSGIYQFRGQLQALAPMALSVMVDGTVQTALPSSRQPVTVTAHAEIKGRLAGPDAALTLQAQLLPALTAAPGGATQASVTATIEPWQAQPIRSATVYAQALDLGALWPQLPQMRLDGRAAVTPVGAGWRAGVTLSNSIAGPWDKQRLPLDRLEAGLMFLDGQWRLESLRAAGAGGRIEAKGTLVRRPAKAAHGIGRPNWQGSATLHGLDPAAIDSRLASALIDGQFTAQQTAQGITFDAQLQPARRGAATPASANLGGLRLQTVQAQGLWQAPQLTLQALTLQTDDARLEGRLTVNTQSQAASGELALYLPGADARLAGQIAAASGQGEVRVNVNDATLAARWMARWPGAPAPLASATIQGGAELTGQWQGGWRHQGQALQIQARLRAPSLTLDQADQPPEQTWHLHAFEAEVTGTPRALNVTSRGQAELGMHQFDWQAQTRNAWVSDGVWQLNLDAAQFTAQNRLRPGLWTLRLDEPLALDWKQGDSLQTVAIAGGSAHLNGPVSGTVALSWQPAYWSQPRAGSPAKAKGAAQWRTQGTLQGLPLAWLNLLGQTQVANLGLRGDLLFGGQWQAAGGETLRLRASLERTAGDLQLLTEDAGAARLNAGVREARLLISADGDRLAATLRWDSERAGQAQAEFSTRLRHQSDSWVWPADAPLVGQLRVQLPPVGAWSLLAPPGWRLRGALDADAVLSGLRSAPLWHGTLRAQDLAVRSVADGIDFSQGTLRARFDGERLDIEQFSLQGAGGSGGLLSVTGSAIWLPASATAPAVKARLRMELEAQAHALRVSARADRRLMVSGKLSARLEDARLAIRGRLKADQALFILPEDTAPQLGTDVVVQSAGAARAGAALASTAAPAPAPGRITPEVAITLDLGPDFQVRGRGLVTRLAGALELRSTPAHQLMPRLTGDLRALGGSYKAYGQLLDIEDGILRFAGPYDDPALEILALRPNLQQRVGVHISGTARSPAIRLYAEPDLPDAEKLAWLVLGRSAAAGGAEAALLQQAALALLGSSGRGLTGGLADALGIDEVSVRGAASAADGSSTGATVTLGKRVSRNFYVAYERSLAGTLGTFYIFYDLSRRLTLRAQTGEQSAFDLIFTLRHD